MSASHEGAGGLQSRPFLLLLIASVGLFFGYSLLLPLVPLWVVTGGAGELDAGATTTLFMAATVLTQLVTPLLLLRMGYRGVLVLGGALLGLPAPCYVITTFWVALWGISVVRGIGFGLVTVCASALVAELLPRSLLGRGNGVYGIAVGIPQLLGMPAGVWVARRWGFAPVFWAAGILPVLACLPALLLPRVEKGVETAAPPTRDVLGPLLAPSILMLVAALGYGGLVTFLPISLHDAENVSALVLFTISGAMLVGRWLAGVIGDRAQRAGHQLAPAIVITAAGLALVALAARVHEGLSMAALALLGAALTGGGFGALQNDSLVVMFKRVDRTQFGLVSAVWNAAYDSGTGAGAVLLGALIPRTGYPVAFLAPAALMAAMLPGILISTRRRR